MRERITSAIEGFADSGRGDVRRLQGTRERIYRLRVGQWRIFFSLEARLMVLVLRALPRSGAY
ncbi:MAG: type II toxin-antitoxin system RelE/ParE family toxin [Acidobacteria bacterium]|nr:MAG: type II toxin-antitoxin system RelE/ParE family toxin [Acidobacteriota bacterium]